MKQHIGLTLDIHRTAIDRLGGILCLESKDKLLEQSLALIPDSGRLESLKFYMLAGGMRMPAELV